MKVVPVAVSCACVHEVVDSLQEGLASLLRDPGGCLESGAGR